MTVNQNFYLIRLTKYQVPLSKGNVGLFMKPIPLAQNERHTFIFAGYNQASDCPCV
jgi:hypothetical protein